MAPLPLRHLFEQVWLLRRQGDVQQQVEAVLHQLCSRGRQAGRQRGRQAGRGAGGRAGRRAEGRVGGQAGRQAGHLRSWSSPEAAAAGFSVTYVDRASPLYSPRCPAALPCLAAKLQRHRRRQEHAQHTPPSAATQPHALPAGLRLPRLRWTG